MEKVTEPIQMVKNNPRNDVISFSTDNFKVSLCAALNCKHVQDNYLIYWDCNSTGKNQYITVPFFFFFSSIILIDCITNVSQHGIPKLHFPLVTHW